MTQEEERKKKTYDVVGLGNLPTDLVKCINDYLINRRDLHAISQTNRHLRTSSLRQLYGYDNWLIFRDALARGDLACMERCFELGLDMEHRFTCYHPDSSGTLGRNSTVLGEFFKCLHIPNGWDLAVDETLSTWNWLVRKGADLSKPSCCYCHHSEGHRAVVAYQKPICRMYTPIEQVLMLFRQFKKRVFFGDDEQTAWPRIIATFTEHGIEIPVKFEASEVCTDIYLSLLRSASVLQNGNSVPRVEKTDTIKTVGTLLHKTIPAALLEEILVQMKKRGKLQRKRVEDHSSCQDVTSCTDPYWGLNEGCMGGLYTMEWRNVSETKFLDALHEGLHKMRLLTEHVLSPPQRALLRRSALRHGGFDRVVLAAPSHYSWGCDDVSPRDDCKFPVEQIQYLLRLERMRPDIVDDLVDLGLLGDLLDLGPAEDVKSWLEKVRQKLSPLPWWLAEYVNLRNRQLARPERH